MKNIINEIIYKSGSGNYPLFNAIPLFTLRVDENSKGIGYIFTIKVHELTVEHIEFIVDQLEGLASYRGAGRYPIVVNKDKAEQGEVSVISVKQGIIDSVCALKDLYDSQSFNRVLKNLKDALSAEEFPQPKSDSGNTSLSNS